MTDEEYQRLKAAKRRITQKLADMDLRPYRLGQIDKRIKKYVDDIIKRPEAHNLYEQLALAKFLDKMDRYGFAVRPYKAFVKFYETLYFPGKAGHQQYELTGVQCFQYANVFGFWDGDKRIVREVCLFVPRKFSKTTSTASLALYDLLFGDGNAEVYVAANSQDQSRKCFDVIRGAMFRLDPQGDFYTINQDVVKSRRGDRSAFAQCLTAGARTKDGLNASTVIMDEFSQAKDNSLLTVLTTSMGVRDNPLTVIITTASDLFDGPFYSMLQGYKRLLLGEYEDDSVFAHLFEPDVDDPEDSPETWRKVHPHMDVTVSLDFYRREYQSALRNGAEAMLAFRTKLLNVYAENTRQSWIGSTVARDAMRDIRLESITGKPAGVVAIDLSESDDFSAVSWAVPYKKNKEMIFHTAYFFPEGALPGHRNEQLYRKWVAEGHLILTPGPVIDYNVISEYVLGLSKYIKVMAVGYDPYKSQQVVNTIGNSRPGAWKVLKGVRQNMANFTAPVEAFEHGIKTGHIFINKNPINAFCFGNAVLLYDTNDNCKPWKRQENMKIDGVITMLMCLRQIIDFQW